MQENMQDYALYSISRITARLNHHDILHSAMNVIKQVVPIDALGVYVVSDDKQSVERFSLISGHRKVIAGLGQKLPVSDSELARLAINQDNVIYSKLNLRHKGRLLDTELAIQAGVQSAAAVSISRIDSVCGSVVFDSFAPFRYDSDHLPFFQKVAELIGIYLENQQLFQQALLGIGSGTLSAEQNALIQKLKGDMKWQVTSIALQLDQMRRFAFSDQEFNQSLQVLKQQTQMLLGDLRSCIAQTNARYLTDTFLPDALASELKLFEHRTGMKTRWGMVGSPRELPQEICRSMLRFLQEALSNIYSYAHAHSVKVQLLWQQDAIIFEIEDDGAGFDLAHISVSDKQGVNLSRISTRAEQTGATLAIHSIPGWGTRLTLTQQITFTGKSQSVVQPDLPGADSIESVGVLLVQADTNNKTLTATLNNSPDVKIVGQAVDKEDVLSLLNQVYPDIILIASQPSKLLTEGLLTTLQGQLSTPPIIILDKQTNLDNPLNVPGLTVQQFPGEEVDANALANAICRVAKGESIHLASDLDSAAKERLEWPENNVEPLTKREHNILALIAEGLSNRDIADKLVIQESTVRWHAHNILQKLGAKSRTHATRIAIKRGWLL